MLIAGLKDLGRIEAMNNQKLARLILGSLLFVFNLGVAAQTQRENDVLQAAGGYYAAVMLAREFKGTQCGNIDIDKKWLDLERAKKEIYSKLPRSFHKELTENWALFENEVKTETRELIELIKTDKVVKAGCEKVRTVFWTTFNSGVQRWQSYQ